MDVSLRVINARGLLVETVSVSHPRLSERVKGLQARAYISSHAAWLRCIQIRACSRSIHCAVEWGSPLRDKAIDFQYLDISAPFSFPHVGNMFENNITWFLNPCLMHKYEFSVKSIYCPSVHNVFVISISSDRSNLLTPLFVVVQGSRHWNELTHTCQHSRICGEYFTAFSPAAPVLRGLPYFNGID